MPGGGHGTKAGAQDGVVYVKPPSGKSRRAKTLHCVLLPMGNRRPSTSWNSARDQHCFLPITTRPSSRASLEARKTKVVPGISQRPLILPPIGPPLANRRSLPFLPTR